MEECAGVNGADCHCTFLFMAPALFYTDEKDLKVSQEEAYSDVWVVGVDA